MKQHPSRLGLLVLACLLVTACHGRPDPVKPITGVATTAPAPT